MHGVAVQLRTRATVDELAGFDEVVLACLAKRPEDRPPTAAVLSQRLAQVARELGAVEEFT